MLDTRVTRKNEGTRVQKMFKTLKTFTNMIFTNMTFTNIRSLRIYTKTTVKNQCFYKRLDFCIVIVQFNVFTMCHSVFYYSRGSFSIFWKKLVSGPTCFKIFW